jgi:hypothetical protein
MTRARKGPNSRKSRPSNSNGNRKKKKGPVKAVNNAVKKSARELDRVSRKFDAAVENLRGNMEDVGECLYELLAAEAKRESLRRFRTLAEKGVLHDLQTLAAALDRVPPEEIPEALKGVERYAALAVTQLARDFGVEPIHHPGEVITVGENQQAGFDWSADTLCDRTFPLMVTVLRSGWKHGSDVLVKPKLISAM